MSRPSFASLRKWFAQSKFWEKAGTRVRRAGRVRLALDILEDRVLPSATLQGTVFEDFNADGVQQLNPTLNNTSQGTVGIANEIGVAGVTVTAVNAAGTVVGTATTAANGSYTITDPAGTAATPYRIEFTTLPAGYTDGPEGAGSHSSVQFVTGSAANLNLGLLRASDYAAVADPTLYTQIYYTGDPHLPGSISLGNGTTYTPSANGNLPALVSFNYSAGTSDTDTTLADYENPNTHTLSVPVSAIGTTWGLAYDSLFQKLYAASYTKRFAGYGPGAGGLSNGDPGAIYQIDPTTGAVSVFASIPNLTNFRALAGPGDVPYANNSSYITDNGSDPTNPNLGWQSVGTTSLGGMDVNPDGSALYVMDLQHRTLDVLGRNANGTWNGTLTAVPVPIPTDASAAANMRPFAVKFYNGLVYIGEVDSAQTTQNIAQLRGYVFTFNPATNTFNPNQVLEFSFNYARGASYGGSDNFHPWSATYQNVNGTQNNDGPSKYAQPVLTGLAFDPAGNMVLGVRDRNGDQTGRFVESDPGHDPDTQEGISAGATLRATPNANLTAWALENNGSAGGVATGGASIGFGPGGGMFYFQDNYSNSDTARNQNGSGHNDTTAGGVVQVPGYADVVVTSFDPDRHAGSAPGQSASFRTGGLRWFHNANDTLGNAGTDNKGYILYSIDAPGTFGKAEGTGDVVVQQLSPPLEIGNRIWKDTNGNGIQDAGEPGISGVTVTLFDVTANTTVSTTATSGTGDYVFNNGNVAGGLLFNHQYQVRINTAQAALVGLALTRASQGADTLLDSKATLNVNTAVIALTTGLPGQVDHARDAGFLPLAQLAGVLFDNSAENDGLFHAATDPGINGVTVTLTGTDDQGNAVSLSTVTSTLSGQAGSYLFSGLRPSNASGYTVTETGLGLPASFIDGKDSPPGSLGGNQANQYADAVTAIPVSAGAAGINYNFGEIRPASIAGVLFDNSAENDGLFHAATDPGISGVTVTLTGTDDRGNAVSLSTVTSTLSGQAGSYLFSGLRPSSGAGYTVTETGIGLPASFIDGKDSPPGSLGGSQANAYADAVTAIPVSAGASGVAYNFGELRPANLAGVVFDNSAENDGLFHAATDPGINGVTVTLTGTDDRGNAVNLSTVTSTLSGQPGSYLFSGLRPSNASGYTVTETGLGLPATFIDGKDSPPGSLGGNQANPYADAVTAIPVSAGASGVAYNFGELRPASIAGVLFDNSAENDGLFHAATDPGINGVTVTLTGTDDRGNAVSLSTVTSTLSGQPGSYLFSGLRPSNASGYTVTETGIGLPASFIDGKDSPPGSQGGSQANPYADAVTAIPVSAGVAGINYNFGEIRPASIAGVLFDNSAENDGLFHAATDPGINGVTVTLTGTDDRGNAVSLSTVTSTLSGQPGSYLFSGLRPSNASGYTVTETGIGLPASFIDGKDSPPGSQGGSQANPYADAVTAIPVSAGVAGINYNFGEIRPASIAGVLFDNSAENDGLFHAATDPGINGVTVTLTGTDDRGNAVSLSTVTSTLSGQPGSYLFSGLRPSNGAGYTVTETGLGLPASFIDGKDSPPGSFGGNQANPYADAVTAIPVSAGASGVAYNFGEIRPAQLAGVVFDNSAENDGLFHAATDPGINGVTVTLTGTDDRGNAVSLSTVTSTLSGQPGSYLLSGLRPSNASGYTVTETGLGLPASFIDGKDSPPGSLGGNQANPYADAVTAIPVSAGASGVAYNFGELRPASIAGVLFDNSAENDGLFHAATDPGINGVTVTLTGTDDRGNAVNLSTVTSTLSGQPGSYLFSGLRPSNGAGYTVTETGLGLPASFIDGKDSPPGSLGGSQANQYADAVTAIPVSAGASGVAYNFGELRPAQLSGVVFDNSAENDGLFHAATDPGINGVQVTLTGTDDQGNAVSLSTVTSTLSGQAGSYLFSGLRPSDGAGYTVTETGIGLPATFIDGKDSPPGSLGGNQANPYADAVTAIPVSAGALGVAYNFGELRPASIAGVLFDNSAENDGLFHAATDPGINGVQVTLTGTDDQGNAVSLSTLTSTLSGQPGSYLFSGLRPSNASGYTVTETGLGLPASFIDGKDSPPGSLGGNQANPYADAVTAIPVSAGASGVAYNFGELRPASIAGVLFDNSAENDGLFHAATDPGINGVTVTLTGTDDRGNAVSLSTVTSTLSGQAGSYLFSGLRPSNGAGYTVTETGIGLPASFIDGKDSPPGSLGGSQANQYADAVTAIPVSAGASGVAYNFGELRPAQLSGVVFDNSAENDGLFHAATDPGINGVTVTLTGTDDQGNGVSLSTLTSTLSGQPGSYLFSGLRPSNGAGYTVTETGLGLPATFIDGKDSPPGSFGGNQANPYADAVTAIPVSAGASGVAYNFGELRPASIAGVLFDNSAENDGLFHAASDPGINGVQVTLTGTDDQGNAVSLSTLTSTLSGQPGSYLFSGLRPSNASGYTVTETGLGLPASFIDGKDSPPGSLGGNQANPYADAVTAIPVSAGASGVAYNFGELRPASIAGVLFDNSAENDGLFHAATDPGINGVTVTLTGTDDRGNAVNLSTVTSTLSGQPGSYLFSGLRPSNGAGYTVTETGLGLPASFIDGKDSPPGSLGGSQANQYADAVTAIPVSAGASGVAYNFGEIRPAQLAGVVFDNSAENDGLFHAATDPGINGVQVTLTGTDDQGNAVSLSTLTSTLSGQPGSYLFSGLRPSNASGYTVTETGLGLPASFIDGKDSPPGSFGGNQANPYADAVTAIPVSAGASGVAYNFGELRPASIAGVLFDNSAENDGLFHAATDPGINGVQVTLTGTDDQGNAVSLSTLTSTLSGQPGSYLFSGLRPSNASGYTVTETGLGLPASFIDGKDSPPGSFGGNQANPYADAVTAIPVSAGASGVAYNFGELRPASIAGVLFDNSAENDGLFHAATDPGINGVTVTLTGTDDRGNAVSLSTVTSTLSGQAGSYLFSGLRPSNGAGYTVTETGIGLPASFIDGKDSPPGSLGGSQANAYADAVTAIPVSAGASGVAYNFGELRPANLAGVVFDNSAENDGLFHAATDPGINGVTVTLTGTDDRGNAVSLSTVTSTLSGQPGSYLFSGLRPSNASGYTVTETGLGLPATFIDGKDSPPGSLGGNQANPYADAVTAIPVSAGASGVAYNFGELRPASIAGVLFDNSAENDGLFHAATDPGINGVTVTLTGTDDQGNGVSLSTLTSTLSGQPGSYLFSGLRPSNGAGYTVTETGLGLPATFIDGKDSPPGSFGGNQANPYADAVTAIPVSAGASGVAYNFGELRPASIAGVLFDNSAENDGLFHAASDPGINGVQVTLTGTDDQGSAVSLSSFTSTLNGQPGSYHFSGLRPSNGAGYTVTETGLGLPATFIDGKDSPPGSLGGNQANQYADAVTAIPVSAGALGVAYNFGELRPASIAGVVFDNSAENDGLFHAATDPGINGVTVTLTGTDDQGNGVSLSTLTSTLSGQPGSYLFSGLRPSNGAGYTVTETGLGLSATFIDGKDSPPGSLGGNQADQYADAVTAIPVSAGALGVAYNFGELRPASIAGVVFDNSAENDGLFHAATDPGINGVTVTLTGTDDQGNGVSLSTLTSTLSGQPGSYLFSGLRPSNGAGYTVTETGLGLPATFIDGKDSPPGSLGGNQANQYADAVTAIPVSAGALGVAYNFGELRPASIAGVLFDNSAENDGLFHAATDPGINGVQVTLTGTDDQGNAVSLSTVTSTLSGQAGSYLFSGLRPSDGAGYTVTETGIGLPATFIDGKDSPPGSLGGNQANPYADAVTAIPVSAGALGVAYNFGELRPASIAGVLFDNSAENDGLFHAATDPGINGVQVTLTGTDDQGNAVSLSTVTSTLSGQAGSYLFSGLRPSDGAGYTVTETGLGLPATFIDGKDSPPGSFGGNQANQYADAVTAIPVSAGASGVAYNFGELRPASIAGVLFDNSAENDGLFHAATDPGINGVTVTLTGTDDRGNAVSLSTVTSTLSGQAGSYLFSGLRPSNGAGYTVTETGLGLPATFIDGKDSPPGSFGGNQANQYADAVTAIPVSAGASGVAYNFGELRPASIAGVLFDNSAENDGLFHAASDPGINGVQVTLTGTDDQGSAVSLSSFTSTLNGQPGSYHFSGLRPSNGAGYTVTETGLGLPATFIDGKDSPPGSLGGNQANQYADAVTAIPVSAGAAGINYNFGELRTAGIAGVVFDNSAENDGLFHAATDPGINGVQVTLTGTDDQGNAVSLSTLTSTLNGQPGSYLFSSLRPSDASGYTVTETGIGLPASFIDGKDSPPGSLGGNQANVYADQVTAIPFSAGASGDNYNFGEVRPANIAGVVFDNSAENDGLFHAASDPGINGVQVTLTGTDDQGNAVSLSTVTSTLSGQAGSYLFNGLRPSNASGYTVTETGIGLPASFIDGRDSPPGSFGGSQANPYADVVTAIPVSAGASGVAYNFGELRPASIAGVVFDNSAENDGLFHAASDPGINGVQVTLTGTDDQGNAVSLSTVTSTLNGQAGSYLFSGLRPSNASGYTVTETGIGLPATFIDGKDSPPGSLGGSQANPYADQITAIPFSAGASGVNYNFGEIRPAQLSGVVFDNSSENDGLFHAASDPGINGVQVTLTGTDDQGNAVSFSTLTTTLNGQTGSYLFAGLRPSNRAGYKVTETGVGLPATFIDGKDSPPGSLGGNQANQYADAVTAIPVSAGASGNNYNFGELRPAQLAGVVFDNSAENDGLFHAATDPGINGVTVTLTGTDDQGNAVSLSTLTTTINGQAGSYQFTGLRPSNGAGYTVTETGVGLPASYLDGKDSPPGSLGGSQANPYADAVSAIRVRARARGVNYNFSELRPATIAGVVFDNTVENDGLFHAATDPGINGVVVTLTGTDDQGNTVRLTTTTFTLNGQAGTYLFSGLRPSNAGGYTVTETGLGVPTGFVDGKDSPPGSLGGNQADPYADQVTAVLASAGALGVNYNFGELQQATLSGHVYVDLNGDGVRDAGDTGLPGVTITLLDSNDQVVATTVSGADGSYTFTGLAGGTYTIVVGSVPGYVPGSNNVGTVVGHPDGTLTGLDRITGITVAPGQMGTTYEFGKIPSTTFTGIDGGYILTGASAPPVDPSNIGKYLLLASTVAELPGNIKFVNGIYHELLDRAPDQGGMDGWINLLQTSALSTGQLVRIIDRSAEHRGLQVDHLYQEILHRNSDAGGRVAWVNFVLSGATLADVATAFVSSAEYRTTHASPAALVTGLYEDILGRAPDASEGALIQLVQNGMSAAHLARVFLSSTEEYLQIIDRAYIEYLQRPADGLGQQAFLTALQSGSLSPDTLPEVFLSSPEYYLHAH